ncbi:MAG: hypothetical protein ACKVPY_03895 [Paracoccaceae bacterium]
MSFRDLERVAREPQRPTPPKADRLSSGAAATKPAADAPAPAVVPKDPSAG